jgi:hypothetical protein
MNRPTPEQLLAFLEGTLGEEERTRVLEQLEQDPELARELQSAASGHVAIEWLHVSPTPGDVRAIAPRRVSPWWIAAAAVATLVLAVPAIVWLSSSEAVDRAQPMDAVHPEPGYLVVLLGRWPDAATVSPEERRRRASEYWSWASSLANDSVLMAAGDLRWEPGRRFGPNGVPITVSTQAVESPDFVVGMFAIRVDTYEDAVAIARECPHLRYGGSVSVRQLATGLLMSRTSGG